MKDSELKDKILYYMRSDSSNGPKPVDFFLMIVAKDYTDTNDLNHFMTIYNALIDLEEEGAIVDTAEYLTSNRSSLERIKRSRWKLNKS